MHNVNSSWRVESYQRVVLQFAIDMIGINLLFDTFDYVLLFYCSKVRSQITINVLCKIRYKSANNSTCIL